MKRLLLGLVVVILLLGSFDAQAQNKIYLVSKINNYTTFKLVGKSFWTKRIRYKIQTNEQIYRGFVLFSDSSLAIQDTTILYESIQSIEYSKFNKVANIVSLGYQLVITGVGAFLVIKSPIGSTNQTIGLLIGIPSAIGLGLTIYEVSKPAVYILSDYHIRTKKGSR